MQKENFHGMSSRFSLRNYLIMKLEFWNEGPNSWDSTCQVQPPTPIHQIKRHGEGKERRLHTSGHAVGRGRIALRPSSGIFGVQT
jgi:hypothetical protein